jgi:hypothetical protein
MKRLTFLFVIAIVLSLDFSGVAQTGRRKPRKAAIGAGGAGTYARHRRGAAIGARKKPMHRRRRRGR